jgi:hypothetical protein
VFKAVVGDSDAQGYAINAQHRLNVIDVFSTVCAPQDPANGREALIEAALDESEGADILMVKPGKSPTIAFFVRVMSPFAVV